MNSGTLIPVVVIGMFFVGGGIVLTAVIFAIIQLIRNRSGTGIPPRIEERRWEMTPGSAPSIIGADDNFTNPAHPLYHLHHPSVMEMTGGHMQNSPTPAIDPSPAPPFDNGASVGPPSDGGCSSSGGCNTGGSNCG